MDEFFRRFVEDQENLRRLTEGPMGEINRLIDQGQALERISSASAFEKLVADASHVDGALQWLNDQVDNGLRGYRTQLEIFSEAAKDTAFQTLAARLEASQLVLDRLSAVDQPIELLVSSSIVAQAMVQMEAVDTIQQALQTDMLAASAIAASGAAVLESLRRQSLLVEAAAIADEEMSKETFDFDGFIDRIVNAIVDRIASAKSPLEKFSLLQVSDYLLKVVIPLIVACIALLVAQESLNLAKESADQSETDSKAISEGFSRLEDAVQDLPATENRFSIVASPTPLLGAADLDADTVIDLRPGDIVEILERDGNWIKVAYFNRIHGQTLPGWVRYETLEPIIGATN